MGLGFGDRNPGYSTLILFLCLDLCLHCSLPVSGTRFKVTSDDCNWTGSGSLDKDEHSLRNTVLPVYLRCREGRLLWKHPRQALRVVLSTGFSSKDFVACVLFRKNSSKFVNVYFESEGMLHPLFRGTPSSDKVECFKSSKGRAAIFIEALYPFSTTGKEVVDFSYDLQPLSSRSDKECQPCAEDELLLFFCAADFACRGTVFSMHNDAQRQRTELVVRASKVFKDVENRTFTKRSSGSHALHYGQLHRPLHCETKVGNGEFLFLGFWHLEGASLFCAPRWTEWKRVRQTALVSGKAYCALF